MLFTCIYLFIIGWKFQFKTILPDSNSVQWYVTDCATPGIIVGFLTNYLKKCQQNVPKFYTFTIHSIILLSFVKEETCCGIQLYIIDCSITTAFMLHPHTNENNTVNRALWCQQLNLCFKIHITTQSNFYFENMFVYKYESVTRDRILEECFDPCILVHLYETHENPMPGDL